MDIGNTGLLVTFFLGLASLWLAFTRFRMRLENSWPLAYYLALVVYANKYDLVLNPYVLYVAVVSALLLRFEFMNERVVFLVRIVEVTALLYVSFCMFLVLIKAY